MVNSRADDQYEASLRPQPDVETRSDGLRLHPGDDSRPPSLLRGRPLNPFALIGGAATVFMVYISVFVLTLVLSLLGATLVDADARETLFEEEEPPMMEFVEARFVRLGREFDRELPNKMRAARSTGPEAVTDIPTKNRDRRERPEEQSPVNSAEDLMRRLGTSAAEHARIAENSEREGDEQGIEEGTANRDEGNIYRGQIYAFFRRGFNMPSSVPPDERRGLRTTATVTIDDNGFVSSFVLAGSGNADFDQAVRLRVEQAVGSRLPEPPDEETRAQYWGRRIPVGFTPPR